MGQAAFSHFTQKCYQRFKVQIQIGQASTTSSWSSDLITQLDNIYNFLNFIFFQGRLKKCFRKSGLPKKSCQVVDQKILFLPLTAVYKHGVHTDAS